MHAGCSRWSYWSFATTNRMRQADVEGGAVVSEEGLGVIRAGGVFPHRRSREALAVVEHQPARLFVSRAAVLLDHGGDASLAGSARGDLRTQVAEHGVRHARV